MVLELQKRIFLTYLIDFIELTNLAAKQKKMDLGLDYHWQKRLSTITMALYL